MTQSTIASSELAEKGADADLLKHMMELDVEVLCGAGFGVKNADRNNSRNGYWDRL